MTTNALIVAGLLFGLVCVVASRRWGKRASLDLSGLYFLRVPLNAVSFVLRRRVAWSKGAPQLAHESKSDLFDYLPVAERGVAERRERELRERYHLDDLRADSTRALYRYNLHTLDLLDRLTEIFGFEGHDVVVAADVGSKDFSYACALERFFRYVGGHDGRGVSVTGVEIDGYGVYSDGHSRADYGRAYAALTRNPEVTYRVRDFLKWEGSNIDRLTLFYPFVTRFALLAWGLPLRMYDPGRMVRRVAASLSDGGRALFVNHTVEERERLAELLAVETALVVRARSVMGSSLVDYYESTGQRYVTVVERVSENLADLEVTPDRGGVG